MSAIASRINRSTENSTVKNNDAIVSFQREMIDASSFNSVAEYKAAVAAQRAQIEAHNAQIRAMGR